MHQCKHRAHTHTAHKHARARTIQWFFSWILFYLFVCVLKMRLQNIILFACLCVCVSVFVWILCNVTGILALADVCYKNCAPHLLYMLVKKGKRKTEKELDWFVLFWPALCDKKKKICFYICTCIHSGWWAGRGEAIAIESERCMARGAYKTKHRRSIVGTRSLELYERYIRCSLLFCAHI